MKPDKFRKFCKRFRKRSSFGGILLKVNSANLFCILERERESQQSSKRIWTFPNLLGMQLMKPDKFRKFCKKF
jgi:hypothetical protein